MMKLRFAIPIVLTGALICAVVAAQDDPPPITKVELVRTYEASESQEYTASVKATVGEVGEMSLEARLVRRVTALLSDGAKVEIEYKNAKAMFGGSEMPGMQPEKTLSIDHDKFGMPKAIDLESEDPLGFLAPAFYLPGREVNIGERFEIKWRSSNGTVELEGEGRLMATGMLYEEHVAKMTLKIHATVKDDDPGTFELTTYTNSKTGKLVKAEGTISMGDGAFKGDVVIAKVRS